MVNKNWMNGVINIDRGGEGVETKIYITSVNTTDNLTTAIIIC